jgi:hypothetical protein
MRVTRVTCIVSARTVLPWLGVVALVLMAVIASGGANIANGAAIVHYSEHQSASDRWIYSFSVSNQKTRPSDTLFRFSLYVPTAVEKDIVSAPDGWDARISPQGVLIDFTAIGETTVPGLPKPPGPQILPGETGQFVVAFDQRVGPLPCNVWWYDDDAFGGVVLEQYTTTMVPEPNAWVLAIFASGLLVAGVWHKRARRRNSDEGVR